MFKFTEVEKEAIAERIGILQPSTKKYEGDKGVTLNTFLEVLKGLLDDTELSTTITDKIRKVIHEDIADPMSAIAELLEYSPFNTITSDSTLKDNFKINDEAVGITSVNLNSTTGVLTGATALEAARASLGIRETKKITLFRSGFWIAIGKISTSDVIGLDTSLTNVALYLRKAMLGLEYTTDVYIYLEVIMDFVEKHLIASSLNVPFEEIRNHISPLDMEMLYGGVIDAIEPRGFTNYFKCGNAIKVNTVPLNNENVTDDTTVADVSGMEVVCDRMFTAKLDAYSLLRIADEKLTSEQKVQLIKPKNSLEVSDIENYKALFNNNTEDVTVSDEEISLSFTMYNPSITDIIENGKIWKSNIETALNSLSLGDDPDDKNNAYKKHYNGQALAVFSPYIKRITLNNGAIIEDRESILAVLADITDNDELSIGVSKEVSEYIDRCLVAIFGVPDFICDACNEIHDEDSKKFDFKGFIPINMRKYFFTLLTLKR